MRSWFVDIKWIWIEDVGVVGGTMLDQPFLSAVIVWVVRVRWQ
jgi:hypothetical protein